MPCKYEDNDESRILKKRGLPTAMLRFIGGFGRTPRGPYVQYETGKVYLVHAQFADKEMYPYWEPVDEDEVSEETEDVDDESSVDDEVKEDSTDSTEDDVASSADEEEREPDEGLNMLAYTIDQGGSMTENAGFSEHEAINGMDVATLQVYIAGNHGKVDKRWGRKKLIEEALKL